MSRKAKVSNSHVHCLLCRHWWMAACAHMIKMSFECWSFLAEAYTVDSSVQVFTCGSQWTIGFGQNHESHLHRCHLRCLPLLTPDPQDRCCPVWFKFHFATYLQFQAYSQTFQCKVVVKKSSLKPLIFLSLTFSFLSITQNTDFIGHILPKVFLVCLMMTLLLYYSAFSVI